LKIEFAGDGYSQWGEEHAVRQLVGSLPVSSAHFLVEFGASRGPDNSNFWGLKDELPLVLIEASFNRFQELKKLGVF
jgi:hypothetical protein